ncbi:DEKNAAC103914 [Brettanomyces naardenensis]|uniref:DEKNAAC103914 n=1 Tax=Brettanomyces naardenensis TaxID=13370 RepID=A0A448YPQ1_BRENA|nr:DEKNAAC103914 [Brettanomyces naardenensis]
MFSTKDDNHFHEALRLYEAKQYKKALKTLDSVLKRNPKHYQSLSLKGLSLFYQDPLNPPKEAEQYILKGSSNGSSNPVVCHITGLYYRALKDYSNAAKWYSLAMENKSPNKGILRDLASCLTQIRDYKHLIKPRVEYLDDQPTYRANWTSAAVAYYLNGQYVNAENILTKIEDLIKDHLTDSDMFEHSECLLFKNRAIYEDGDIARALSNLEDLEKSGLIGDGAKLLEYKAEYLEKLDKKQEASVVFRTLLQRNPENYGYYLSLERCLGTDKMGARVRLALYEKLAKYYPRSDPPQFIPLTFLEGEEFAKKAEQYLVGQLRRGVPSTFVNVKPLYKKRSNWKVLYEIVKKFYDTEENPLSHCWAGYYLCQHYYHIKEYEKALESINEVIEQTPTLVELYMMKARVLKRKGLLKEAAEEMDQARKLDLQDRFVNSKAVKYYLRANEIRKAIDIASLFTRNEGNPNGVQDLHMMQCVWFLTESAEAYERLYREAIKEWKEGQSEEEEEDHSAVLAREHLKKRVAHSIGLAIKRFLAVVKVFEEYEDDQFDFHHYSMRKGTPRTYIEMLEWEDRLYHEPMFLRSAIGLSRLYLEVSESEEFGSELLTNPLHNLNRTRKEKKEEAKKREELVKYSRGYAKDEDVFGEKILKEIVDRNEEVSKFLAQLGKRVADESNIDSEYVVFAVNQYLKKYVLCLQAFNKVCGIDKESDYVKEMYGELEKDMKDEETPEAVRRILGSKLEQLVSEQLVSEAN